MIGDIIFLRKAMATNTTRNEKYTVYRRVFDVAFFKVSKTDGFCKDCFV